MKEAGDGLHAQMNSMMGALQELKLLQVQTALESLDISGRPINRGPPPPASAPPPLLPPSSSSSSSSSSAPPSSSLETTSSTQRRSQPDRPQEVPRRWSGYTAPQADFCGPAVGSPPPEPQPRPGAPPGRSLDLPSILYSLSREGPSLDSDYSRDSVDDSSDWTSSLMSQRRNRQPLVLGDNVFADLVGNWLDLPELERGEEVEEEQEEELELEEMMMRKRRGERMITDEWPDRPDSPAHPLRLSKSQEISKKFSLTTNIFKKFLRSVRPDRDKLLKERPGWVAPEHPQGELLFKRPKKAAPKSGARGSFYLPFWAAGQQQQQQQGGRPGLQGSQGIQVSQGLEKAQYQQQHHPTFPGIYLDRKATESRSERTQPLFDHNTAVWV